jgi:hypothetical protein
MNLAYPESQIFLTLQILILYEKTAHCLLLTANS